MTKTTLKTEKGREKEREEEKKRRKRENNIKPIKKFLVKELIHNGIINSQTVFIITALHQ